MMLTERVILVVVFLWSSTAGNPLKSDDDSDKNLTQVVYDQRQSGKYNIHLSIKDVAIIEMAENDFLEENIADDPAGDYYYDEADLTVKPWLFPFTQKPASNSTSETSKVNATASPLETNGDSTEIQEPVVMPNKFLTPLKAVPSYRNTPFSPMEDSRIYNFKMRQQHLNSHRGRNVEKRCRSGMVPDEHGNCRAKRSNTILKRLFSMLSNLPISLNDD
ncbi:hypothetical protein ACFFRR_004431 [Megaselia abdita]